MADKVYEISTMMNVWGTPKPTPPPKETVVQAIAGNPIRLLPLAWTENLRWVLVPSIIGYPDILVAIPWPPPQLNSQVVAKSAEKTKEKETLRSPSIPPPPPGKPPTAEEREALKKSAEERMRKIAGETEEAIAKISRQGNGNRSPVRTRQENHEINNAGQRNGNEDRGRSRQNDYHQIDNHRELENQGRQETRREQYDRLHGIQNGGRANDNHREPENHGRRETRREQYDRLHGTSNRRTEEHRHRDNYHRHNGNHHGSHYGYRRNRTPQRDRTSSNRRR